MRWLCGDPHLPSHPHLTQPKNLEYDMPQRAPPTTEHRIIVCVCHFSEWLFMQDYVVLCRGKLCVIFIIRGVVRRALADYGLMRVPVLYPSIIKSTVLRLDLLVF